MIGKVLILFKSFFVKLSFLTRKTQFWQSCRSFFAKIRVFRCSDSKKVEQDCFSGKLFLFEMIPGQEKCSFHNSAGNKSLISSFFPKVRKRSENLQVLQQKLFFVQLFLKTPTMHFLDNCLWFYSWGWHLLPLKAQRDEQICTFFRNKIVFPLSVCGTREIQTWQLCWIEFVKLRSFFCSKPQKMDKNVYLFTKITFPRNVCWTGEKQVWHVCRITFAKLREYFCSKPKKLNKFVFILSNDFTWRYSLDTKNAVLTDLPKQFCWILDFFLVKMRKKMNKIVVFPVDQCFLGVFRGH